VEATTREPFGDVTEEGKEVDGEETGGEEDVKLVGCLVGDANQFVVLVFRPVSVRYPEDDDANGPIAQSVNPCALRDLPRWDAGRTCGRDQQSFRVRPICGGASVQTPLPRCPGTSRR
jgi:hypothetical protein